MIRKLWLLLLVLLMLAGCANTYENLYNKVHSNKEATYIKTLDRILISISSLEHSSLKAEEVAARFYYKLSGRGITVQTIVLKNPNPLELDRGKELAAQIYLFKPNQIMEMAVTNAMQTGYNSSYWLESKIHDTATNKQVWRSTYFSKSSLKADKFVDEVVQKLEADGLLPQPITQ
jgi:hypothetical protein